MNKANKTEQLEKKLNRNNLSEECKRSIKHKTEILKGNKTVKK